MSGFWSIKGISDHEELWVDIAPSSPGLVPCREAADGRKQWLDPATSLLVWLLPFVHVGELNAGNLHEAFLSIRMLELAQGPMLSVDGKPAFLNLSHLRRRLGLRVGAGMRLPPLDETLVQALRDQAKQALADEKKKNESTQ